MRRLHEDLRRATGTARVDEFGLQFGQIALVYAGLNDRDDAFQWLEAAYAVRDRGLTYLKVDPCVDPLRSDPRFASLIKRIGFPDV